MRAIFAVLVFLATLHGGHCAGTFFNPANGSVVTQLIGTVNVTFECVVELSGVQQVTQWNIENFRGMPEGVSIRNAIPDVIFDGPLAMNDPFFQTFRSILIFPTFLGDLHETTLTCGFPRIGEEGGLRNGQFFLQVYREPQLFNISTPLRFVEGQDGLMASVEDTASPAFPFPTVFQWSREGEGLLQSDSRRTFGYPNFTIDNVRRSDSGRYSLTATNFFNNSTELGTGSGSITVDVLYGPELDTDAVPSAVAVRLNDPLALLCGDNLQSNPLPSISWTNPSGAPVTSDSRLTGVDSLRLEIAETRVEDTGTWTCALTVEGVDVTQPGGTVAPTVVVGGLSNTINVTVVVAPSVPFNLSVDDSGATWVNMCWQIPANPGRPGVTSYTVVGTDGDGTETRFMSPITRLNATGLLPNTMYEFRVQAVAAALGVESAGGLSNPVNIVTMETVPDPSCDAVRTIPGGFRVEWSFVHRGGVPLIALTVEYVSNGNLVTLSVLNNTTSSTDVSPLLTNEEYMPMIEASNSAGSTRAECQPVRTVTGIPRAPSSPMFSEMGQGNLRVIVQSLAPGLEPGGEFYFILFQAKSNQPNPSLVERMLVQNYVSGENATFSVQGLEIGDNYTFTVQAENRFGRSENASSNITITGEGGESGDGGDGGNGGESGRESSTGSNAGAIAGGVIAAIVVITVVIIIVVVAVVLLKPRFHSYKPTSSSSPTVKYFQAPSGVKVEEIPEGSPDIGVEINTSTAEKKELHYAELDSFRSPPSGAKTSPDPSKTVQVEPVTYAVIDTFKKALPEEQQAETPATVV